MNNQFGALQGFDSFGTQQPVRIRNNANDVGLVHALGILETDKNADARTADDKSLHCPAAVLLPVAPEPIATVPRVRSSASMFAAVSENAPVSMLVSIGGFREVLQKQRPAQLVGIVGDEIGGGCESRTPYPRFC